MLFATVDGSNILVGSFADGKSQKTLTGHLDDVNTVQFFPSNLVLLSGGADFQLKIWSVIDGSNPVTLKGHTSGITSTAIIDKGRNILSSSRDGKAYLWNCGNGSILSTLGNYSAAINKMILTQLPPTYQPAPVDTLLPNEIGTEDKMVLVALGDGSVQGLHLGTKAKLFASEPTGIALTAIAYDEISSLLFTGNEQGQICIYALTRGLKEPIATWQRNQSPVTSLVLKLSKNGERVLCVANADGGLYQTSSLAIIYEPEPKIHVEVEYTGNDLEKITDMKVLQNEKESYQPLVCSIKDGKIKIY
ncbi:WD40-repeat-containing domain protein [Sporodiniella umbellata]|nr:WD40-repeat-containing domain protein [Sporodiniella umbellata]